jgi:signal transduction histidine kinase
MTELMGLLPAHPERVHALIYDWFDDRELGLLENTAIDELIHVDDSAEKVKLRLNLRAELNHQRSDIRRQVRELQMKEARAETVLLQREEFLSVCAHDLRSPLGLIHSSLSLILSQNESLNENQLELIERAKRQAGHGIRLVNDLLDVMSYEQGLKPQYQLIDLNNFLNNFYRDYAFQAQQKNINLRYENSLEGWKILMDPDRIQQLFQNLLVNAIKFTEPGKNIFLNVMSFKGRRKVDPPFPMAIVSVRDEGKGIPEPEIEKIFSRFSQIKDYSRMEGRGLGLTVAKQISNLHDGNLWVKSIEGEGSTFFVLFPHVLSQTQKQEKDTNGKRVSKILIADSDKDQPKLLGSMLSRWGFEPIYAKDGIEMVTFAYYYQPEVILSSLNLNKLNQEEAAEIIKSQLKMTSVPIFSCVPNDHVSFEKPAKSLIDGVLKAPLDRMQFEKALEGFSQKNPTRKKKAA